LLSSMSLESVNIGIDRKAAIDITLAREAYTLQPP